MNAETRPASLRCVNGFTLKLIALITMTIDHTAAVLVVNGSLYLPMRIIGRIAFPIYCFLLVEGYFHTRSAGKYTVRLLIAAALSEIPFDLAFESFWPSWYSQSVMLTLSIGLVTVWLVDRSRGWAERVIKQGWLRRLVTAALCLAFSVTGLTLAELCCTDYSGGGVLLILLFYFFRRRPLLLCVTVFAELYLVYGGIEPFGIVAMIPILLYNGQRGPMPGGRWGQWFFYLYYPLHLGILAGLYAAGVVW